MLKTYTKPKGYSTALYLSVVINNLMRLHILSLDRRSLATLQLHFSLVTIHVLNN